MSQLESEMKSAMNLCHQQAKKLLIFSQESGDPIFLVLLNSDLTNSSNSGS